MPRKRKTPESHIVGAGYTAKQMRRKKPINSDLLVDVEPLTENQKKFFASYEKGQNSFLYGCAGTGKTFIALYNALKDVLSDNTPYQKIYIVRSLVSTRRTCLRKLIDRAFWILFEARLLNTKAM